MKQNTITCGSCSAENPYYQLTCKNCSAYLRERIFNIDLWDTVLKLIESPSAAYSTIIQAEHKNFIGFILFFASIKLAINSIYLSLAVLKDQHYVYSIPVVLGVSFALLIAVTLLITFLFTRVLKTADNKTRFRDNFAVLTYSMMPNIFALAILFPIELIVFGYTVFSVNPHPFIIKETVAWIMLSMEALFMLWALFLSFKAFRKQSGGNLSASIFTIMFYSVLYIALYFAATFYTI